MNNYENWAHLVAKKLKGEADVITAIEKDELDDAAATEAFVRTVLQPFLPESFGVGSGHIIDAYGNRSDYLEVVVYNRNFPRIRFSGTQSDYLYESVLAAFSIRAKYIRKTFFESMDACASLAKLETKADYNVLIQLAKRNGLKPGPNKHFVHEDPLRTTRFELIGRPPAFMFGFNGIKGSLRQLQEHLELWVQQRQQDQIDTPMRAFPAVIATQGCFAWRNAAPLALSNREMLGLGLDDAPIRLIILQLLHLLNRRLNFSPDGFGLKPNLASYLSQFTPPEFQMGVGDVEQLVSLRARPEDRASESSSQPARDHAPSATDTPEEKPPARAAAAAKATTPQAVEPTPTEPQSVAPATSTGTFDKPSPFASAPAAVADAVDAPEPPASAGARMPTLGSAPIPSMGGSLQAEVPTSPPTAPLGSAPIPSMDRPVETEAEAKPPVAPLGSAPIPSAAPSAPAPAVIPAKPPVDIELTGETELPDEIEAEDPVDFEATMVIAPDASLSSKNPENSTNAFIDRVKQQLANGESSPQKKEESFASTVPH